MIPHQLQIKNFLSYGPETQTIDFKNYHLICLSGKNGHGKSAMLDAITWAIWGQARKTSMNSKPDAGLLHLGQKHMMVIIEFEVNGQQYRIRREFLNTASKPFATLDFGIKNTDGKLVALTDKTIKDTQEKIEKMIGITYDAFINSTFLRQGQSNEFSKKSPKERKEILAQILQLQQFEQQKKIALAHAKKLHQDWLLQDNITKRIDQELQSMSNVQEQHQTIVHNLAELQTQRTIFSDEKIKLEQQELLIQQKLHEKNSLQQQCDAIRKKLQQTIQELQQIETALLQYQNLDIETLQQTEQQLITELTQFQKIHQQKLQLKERYLSTKETLNDLLSQQQKKLQEDQQTLLVKLTQVQEQLQFAQQQYQNEYQKHITLNSEQISLQTSIHEMKQAIEPLLSKQRELQILEKEFEINKQQYQTEQATINQITEHINQHQHALQALLNHAQDHCTQCFQSINAQQKQQIIINLQAQITNAENKCVALQKTLAQRKQTLIEQHKTIKHLQELNKQYIQQDTQLQEQEKNVKKLHHALTEQLTIIQQKELLIANQELIIKAVSKQLLDIELAHNNALQTHPLIELQETLRTCETEAKKLSLPVNALEQTQQKLSIIQQQMEQAKKNTDHVHQSTLHAQKETLRQQIKLLNAQIQELEQQQNSFTTLQQDQKIIVDQKHSLLQNYDILEKKIQTALIDKGSLEEKQKKQIKLESELDNLRKTMHMLHQEMIDYQDIAKALGKDGIQALLIEQAIPEIEHETNQILARLTNNQTQIFIESLRDLKKGGSKETLDIKISDSFGLRDYEMFSGGEAFRIDFALRIGISKLLARRAGTTLQTIFIDEGFGSQDEEGLQLIMDNIYKIQNDFAKIVVVSHLPEMKEQFPVQFVIEKKRSGSTVSVIEHG
ncbi:SMC family ATPase [Candidatus Babeliales bacterium]|nr:SMC family ATPase [Candidatus Babeliales bacterium]